MATVLTFLLRTVLLAAGVVMALSLAVAFAVLVAAWLARAAWARLTGRPVSPFVMRVNPREGFRSVYPRAGAGAESRTPRADAVSSGRRGADVTDVEPRSPGA